MAADVAVAVVAVVAVVMVVDVGAQDAARYIPRLYHPARVPPRFLATPGIGRSSEARAPQGVDLPRRECSEARSCGGSALKEPSKESL